MATQLEAKPAAEAEPGPSSSSSQHAAAQQSSFTKPISLEEEEELRSNKQPRQVEVTEYQTMRFGPFPEGMALEVVDAWYGVPGIFEKQVDCTDWVRRNYSPTAGLVVSRFNSIFSDPAPGRLKRMGIHYHLTNLSVREFDVANTRYVEGVNRVAFLPVLAIKALTNVVGATLATGGYGVAKVATAMHHVAGNSDRSVADSETWQFGFNAWLKLNGIFPSVTYEPLPPDEGGRAEDMMLTPVIVSNHVCYLDGPILAALFQGPRILAKKGTLSVPLFGTFAEELGVMEVDRDDPDSRTKTQQAISQHCEEWRAGKRGLLLFPEGTTSNGEHLIGFKKGAFVPGVPVRPVILTYTGSWNPANTSFKTNNQGEIEGTTDIEWCEQFLGHIYHSLNVKVLRPYNPSEEERADPKLYMDNVHQLMGDKLLEMKMAEEVGAAEGGGPLGGERSQGPLQGLLEFAQDGLSRFADTFKFPLSPTGSSSVEDTATLGGSEQRPAVQSARSREGSHRG